MATVLTPDKVQTRHHHLALLLVKGTPTDEIAANLRRSKNWVYQASRQPLVQELVQRYRDEFIAGAARSLQQDLVTDAPRTLNRLKELRDQQEDLKVALGASNALFDRQVPRRTLHEEDRTIRFVFSSDEQARLKQIQQEAVTIDMTDAEEVGRG